MDTNNVGKLWYANVYSVAGRRLLVPKRGGPGGKRRKEIKRFKRDTLQYTIPRYTLYSCMCGSILPISFTYSNYRLSQKENISEVSVSDCVGPFPFFSFPDLHRSSNGNAFLYQASRCRSAVALVLGCRHSNQPPHSRPASDADTANMGTWP
jgi:hypothetical protein